MTRDEIDEFILKNSEGKSGLAAVGPILDQLLNFAAWQQEQIEELKFEILVLKNLDED